MTLWYVYQELMCFQFTNFWNIRLYVTGDNPSWASDKDDGRMWNHSRAKVWQRSRSKRSNNIWVCLQLAKLPKGISCLLVPVIYHPPAQSQASNTVLINYIISSVDKMHKMYHDASFIIGGNFNQIKVALIHLSCALNQVITLPTQINATLDILFTNMKN